MTLRPLLPAALVALLTPAAALAQAPADADTVLAAARAAYGGACYGLSADAAETGAYTEPPQRWQVTVPPDVEGLEPMTLVVWQVFCDAGAYNLSYLYWVEGPYTGLVPLAFPKSVFEVILERPDDFESPVREVRPTGWTATDRLVNASFDPATLTFSHYGKWRGLGDAFDGGSWVLRQEGVGILSYEVDASYDDQQTPVTLFPAP